MGGPRERLKAREGRMHSPLPLNMRVLPKPPHGSPHPFHSSRWMQPPPPPASIKELSQRYQPSKAASRLPQTSVFQLQRPFLQAPQLPPQPHTTSSSSEVWASAPQNPSSDLLGPMAFTSSPVPSAFLGWCLPQLPPLSYPIVPLTFSVLQHLCNQSPILSSLC